MSMPQTLAIGTPVFMSLDGRRIVISGYKSKRLYVTHTRGCTMYLRRPSLIDWMLGRVFGWWL